MNKEEKPNADLKQAEAEAERALQTPAEQVRRISAHALEHAAKSEIFA